MLTSYTPDGQVATLTAVNPATTNQVTTYIYGTSLSTSAIARSDLLVAEVYPDSTDRIYPSTRLRPDQRDKKR